ncbi:MAG: hypothetical protein DLM52_06150 [Chthoniobacterales bacterium]|nr:MAG: hypothetical protein DLM52_06150 [Chthoniobacterales bacterium]
MRETTWSKLRELWMIRRRCRQIQIEQRQSRRWKTADQTTGGLPKSTLPTGLSEVRFENI